MCTTVITAKIIPSIFTLALKHLFAAATSLSYPTANCIMFSLAPSSKWQDNIPVMFLPLTDVILLKSLPLVPFTFFLPWNERM